VLVGGVNIYAAISVNIDIVINHLRLTRMTVHTAVYKSFTYLRVESNAPRASSRDLKNNLGYKLFITEQLFERNPLMYGTHKKGSGSILTTIFKKRLANVG